MSTFIILFGAFLSYLPFIISEKFGGVSVTIGLLLMSMSATTALTSTLLGRLVKKVGQIKLLSSAFIIYAAAILLIYYVPEFWMLPFATILFGVAHGLNLPNVQSIIAGMAPTEHRAAFMSVNRMVAQLGQAVGPVLMSLVFSAFAIQGVFWASAGLAIFVFVLIITFVKK